MKKLFAVLLALVIVGGAFAQATVNGYVRGRAVYTEDAFNYANQRVRLNLGWTSEDKNVTFGARYENDFASSPMVKYAYGKIKLADGMFAVSGGYLWNYDYDLSSGLSEYSLGNVANGAGFNGFANVKGMIVQAMPVEGLSIGLLVKPDAAELGINQFALAASYTIDGIGDIVLSGDFNDPTDTSLVSASFKYTGVEGLGIIAGYKGLDVTSAYAIIEYEMDALTANIAGDFNVDTSGIYAEASIQYALNDSLKLMGLFGYDTDHVNLTGDYFLGGEILYTVGKGLIGFYPTYADVDGFSLPIAVKVSF